MSDRSKIEWTDATWNPIRARRVISGATGASKIGWHCEHVSEGCANCYAEGINKRLGTGLPFKPGHRKDIVEVFLDEKTLLAPLRWKKPRMVFVCSMTDLFADFVDDDWIDKIFAVMALCPQHTFQMLTKRAERMHAYLTSCLRDGINYSMNEIAPQHWCKRELKDYGDMPLKNVWLGISAERQQEADERIPHLLQTPAAVRFVSLEPLLGAIDLQNIDGAACGEEYAGLKLMALTGGSKSPTPWHLNWVIVGGESGPKARPMHPRWARGIRDQCEAAGVPYFFKQWGAFKPGEHYETPLRVGKTAAGRLLDGREHNDMPRLSASVSQTQRG